MRNPQKILPYIRALFIILLVFATNNLYEYLQYLYRSEDWLEAIRMQGIDSWIVLGGALIIIVLYIWLEKGAHKQGEEEKSEIIKLLEANNKVLIAIANKMGIKENEYRESESTKEDKK